MSPKDFMPRFKRLCAAYGKDSDKDTFQVYYDKLSWSAPDVLDTAIDMLLETKTSFPSISSCLAMVDSVEWNIAKQLEAEQRRQNESTYQGNAESKEYARKVFGLIDKLNNGDMTRKQYVESCEEIGHNMSPLRKYYQDHKLAFDGYAFQGARRKQEVSE